jgi:predicted 3-demethylubiquinone-9 3-methyltransferase (glyoxalase superfamily)
VKKITPFLWFDTQALEAAKLYVSVFKNSKVLNVGRAGPGPKAPVMSVSFRLDGVDFVALNGGPQFKFSEATSFLIDCADQKEVNHFWNKLVKGGTPGQCGWLKDRFGVSWQVVPRGLGTWIQKPLALGAMLKMQKLDIKTLKAAASAAK